eukprot:338596-Hanusia_phi.AAC.4
MATWAAHFQSLPPPPDADLAGGEPEGPLASQVLDEDGGKPLNRPLRLVRQTQRRHQWLPGWPCAR